MEDHSIVNVEIPNSYFQSTTFQSGLVQERHYSLVVERQPCKLKVLGSIPSGGYICARVRCGCRCKPSVGPGPFPEQALGVYSSAVERLTADQQVPGSNPGVPFFFNAAALPDLWLHPLQ